MQRVGGTMEKDEDEAASLAHPSVSTALRQTIALVTRVGRVVTDTRYPEEARRIARLFWLLANRARIRLESMRSRGTPRPDRVRSLARMVQRLHASLRYLNSSDPQSTPPGVQFAVTELVRRFVVPTFGCAPDDVVALVRPQWSYNLKFVDILAEVRRNISVADLDENDCYDDDRPVDDFLRDLWADAARDDGAAAVGGPMAFRECVLPRFAAVLSFSALDRDDALSYPLLAHEVGHFLHLCAPPPLAYSGLIPELAQVELKGILATTEYNTAPENVPDKLIEQWSSLWRTMVDTCVAEVIADLCAARMGGLSFFIAFADFLKDMAPLLPDCDGPVGYPDPVSRLEYIWDELAALYPDLDTDEPDSLFSGAGPGHDRESVRAVLRRLRAWRRQRFADPSWRSTIAPAPGGAADVLSRRLRDVRAQLLPSLREHARRLIPDDRTPRYTAAVPYMIDALHAHVPPYVDSDEGRFAEILSAAWLHELRERAKGAPTLGSPAASALIFKALELDGTRGVFGRPLASASLPASENAHAPAVTSSATLLRRIKRDTSPPNVRDLVVVPPRGDGAIQSASLELHLGHWFRTGRRSVHSAIDLSDPTGWERARHDGQEEVYVRAGEAFTLPPGGFALSASVEYVAVPNDLMAYLASKASLGRAGLIVTTAGQVAPGFKGCFVLELVNAGDVPLVLRPGMPIAQLVFHTLDAPLPDGLLYQGRFQFQVRP